MKRGCLIVLIAVPLLLIAVAAFAYHRASTTFGLSVAERVSHATLVTPQTRLRLVVDDDKLIPFVKGLLPAEGVKVPWYASYFVSDPIQMLLPYEIAVLGGADYKDNSYGLTLFANERMFGPAVGTIVRQRLEDYQTSLKAAKNNPTSQFFNSIHWQEGFINSEKRGILQLSAGLPLPAGMQNRVLKNWQVDKTESKETIEGGNLIEGVLDNTGGDLMTLVGTAAKSNGVSLEQAFAVPQIEQAVKAIDTIRLTGNLTGDDEFTLVIRAALNSDEFMIRAPFQAIANAVIDGSSMLETLASMGQRTVTPDTAAFKGLKMMLAPYGVTADYKGGEKPVFDGKTLVASYVFTGFRKIAQQYVDNGVQQLAAMQGQ